MSPHRIGSGWSSLKTSRLELFYVAWLASHAYVATFVDCQALYPSWVLQFFPKFLLNLPDTWYSMSGDPLAGSLSPNWKGRPNEFTWFWALTVGLELLVEIPTAIIGAVGIWKNIKATWIVVLVYGTVTAASLLPCIATVWYAPPPGVILSDPTMVSLTDYQKQLIIGSYIPFFVVPLWMAVDASRRIWHFIDVSERVQIKVTKIE